MSLYTASITDSLIVFPFIALLISLPFALFQYHKYGSIPWLRVLVFFSFIYYLSAIIFLTLFPLPDRSDASLFSFAKHFEPIPFNNLMDYFTKNPFTFSLSYIKSFFLSKTFLQLSFNVLMLFPFGIYLRYYFKCTFKKTVLFSFLFSLFLELSQLSGLYFIYPGPYRTFDADDLICNTLGGTLGWLLSPAFTFFLPKRKQIDQKAIVRSQKVTSIRRFTADLTDFILFALLDIFVFIIMVQFGFTEGLPQYGTMTAVIALQCIYALVSKGKSPGKAICRLQIVCKEGSFTFRILFRYGLLWFMTAGITLLKELFLSNTAIYTLPSILSYILGMLILIIQIVILIDLVMQLFYSDKPLLYETLSKTHLISTMTAEEKKTV